MLKNLVCVFRIQAEYGIEDAEKDQLRQDNMKMASQQIRKVFDTPVYENLETLADEMLTQEEMRIRTEERARETDKMNHKVRDGTGQELVPLDVEKDEGRKEFELEVGDGDKARDHTTKVVNPDQEVRQDGTEVEDEHDEEADVEEAIDGVEEEGELGARKR